MRPPPRGRSSPVPRARAATAGGGALGTWARLYPVDPTARRTLEGLADLPGGSSLLKAADRFSGLWLVGGAVRDLLLDRAPRDVDLAVEGEVLPVAQALGEVAAEHG